VERAEVLHRELLLETCSDTLGTGIGGLGMGSRSWRSGTGGAAAGPRGDDSRTLSGSGVAGSGSGPGAHRGAGGSAR
jgi:hypothetical protein